MNLTAALASIGRDNKLSREQILSLLGESEISFIKRSLDLSGGTSGSHAIDLAALLRTYRTESLRPESLAATSPAPGAYDALDELRGLGYRMVICTGRSQAAAEALLDRHRLR
eukprot:CAMPEP_0172190812 /NCGR_PEP_ID=MMETSP1050-20130122/23328_1 /TAXON_ID=233186 /ORGANISM="Cryptomonas curvata, Strain CCAP979/52" /LENGTH=112 /DNA_ID=CAMNT_0012865741 /DNA_START=304 /DNA_END=639 /DNA_ORIENTATION=-